MRWQGWLFLVLVVALASYPAYTYFSREYLARPDRQQMRDYRLAKHTDQQLLQLYERAKADFEKFKKIEEDRAREFWKERDQRMSTCEANPAEKLRRGSCFEPLPLLSESIGKPLPGSESPETIFEQYLLGPCVFLDSVHEAKARGCLPE
jgi:hypothetical protein